MLRTTNTAMALTDDTAEVTEYDLDYNSSDPTDFYNLTDWCEAGVQELTTIKVFQSLVFCLIFLVGISGNCLVIAIFSLYRRFRLRSMTDVFLFHLALADLLLLLTLPLQAIDTHVGWIFAEVLCMATRACYAINTYSGLMLLACISVDRYMVVAKAQLMLRLRSQIVTGGKVAAVCVWVIAVLLSLPEILYSGVSTANGEHFCVMKISGMDKQATNGAIIGIFCVSFLVMMTCYSLIAKVLWEGRTFNQGKHGHRQRTLKLMISLVVVFVLFQLPYTVVLLYKMTVQLCELLLEYITCTLAYTRCCLNPILYALVGVRFRNDTMKLLRAVGCPCSRTNMFSQTVSSTSMSPPLAISSPCSPTSPDRSTTSGYNEATKFKFPN